jgi:hypothetical protein
MSTAAVLVRTSMTQTTRRLPAAIVPELDPCSAVAAQNGGKAHDAAVDHDGSRSTGKRNPASMYTGYSKTLRI